MQYPYLLYTWNQPDATQVDGQWVQPAGSWVLHSKCRDENGGGRQVKGEDGNVAVVNYLIQCPKNTPTLASKTKVRVLDAENAERLVGNVIYSRKDRFHTRIFV